MIPYEVGETVTIQLGDRVYSGRVSGVTAQSIEATFPIAMELGVDQATLRWPGQLAQPVDFEAIKPQTQLVLKLPIDSLPLKSVPAVVPPPVPGEPLSGLKAEMRRSVRVPIELPVKLIDLHTQVVLQGETVDLSSGGLRITVPEPLHVGREYMVMLPLDEETEVRVRVLRRLSPEVFAVKFLCEREVGHRIMRQVFSRVRGDQPASQTRRMNFRRG